jgi:two-component system OmpR family sensor kinase
MTVAVMVGVALLSVLSEVLVSRRLTADMGRTLLRESSAFSAALAAAGSTGAGDLQSATRSYLDGRQTYGAASAAILLVKFANGKILSNSDVPLERAEGNGANLQVSKSQRSISTVTLDHEQYRVATMPIRDANDKPVAVFQSALPVAQAKHMSQDLVRSLALAGLLIVLLSSALSIMVARATLRPLHDAAQTARDVTQQSLSQRVTYRGPMDDVGMMVTALNDMLDRLESSFAEQRRFVADASHEMRTPLTVIRGHLDVMRQTREFDPDAEETLDLVSDELDRTILLVNDLLSLARLEAGPPRPFKLFDLAEIAEDAVVRAQGLGLRRISLDRDAVLMVLGDRGMLLQALLNLLGNAVNHTSENALITVLCHTEGNMAVVTVEDDGPGIPAQDLDRVFDRFYRSMGIRRGGDSGGSGLGLAISRRLVQLHQGDLTVANRPEGGARFRVAVPLARV